MGVGKTTIAKKLGKILDYKVYDTDIEIEKQEKKSIEEIFNQKGEKYFREIESIFLRKFNIKSIISCGGGTAIHNNNMSTINNKGITIYLKASTNYLYNNLKKNRHKRPLIANISNKDLENYINKDLKKREPFYNLAQHTIYVDDKDEKQILKEIHSLIISF
tara:strand:+ start:161 stop:646 length:486 start_codon:yes stop_codon:yes gene_type:complete